MNKKQFTELLIRQKDKYKCLVIDDLSVKYGTIHTAIKIVWKNTTDYTTVKVLRCEQDDERIILLLAKYKRWANIL
jgi:hypothetical protein